MRMMLFGRPRTVILLRRNLPRACARPDRAAGADIVRILKEPQSIHIFVRTIIPMIMIIHVVDDADRDGAREDQQLVVNGNALRKTSPTMTLLQTTLGSSMA